MELMQQKHQTEMLQIGDESESCRTAKTLSPAEGLQVVRWRTDALLSSSQHAFSLFVALA